MSEARSSIRRRVMVASEVGGEEEGGSLVGGVRVRRRRMGRASRVQVLVQEGSWKEKSSSMTGTSSIIDELAYIDSPS